MSALSSLTTASRPLVVIWVVSIAAVSYLSLKPNTQSPIGFERADLILHAAAYLWLSLLPFFTFHPSKLALVCALLMFPLGLGLELGQLATPGRFFSGMDIVANTVGIVLGILLFRFLRSRYDLFHPPG